MCSSKQDYSNISLSNYWDFSSHGSISECGVHPCRKNMSDNGLTALDILGCPSPKRTPGYLYKFSVLSWSLECLGLYYCLKMFSDAFTKVKIGVHWPHGLTKWGHNKTGRSSHEMQT